MSQHPMPPASARENTLAKEKEWTVPANNLLAAMKLWNNMLTGEEKAAAASGNESSSVVTNNEAAKQCEIAGDADFSVEDSPQSSEDSNEGSSEGRGTADELLKELVEDAEGSGIAATDISENDLEGLIARQRRRSEAQSDPPIPAPPTDAFPAPPAEEDAERERRERLQRREAAVARSRADQDRRQRLLLVSRERRQRSQEAERKKRPAPQSRKQRGGFVGHKKGQSRSGNPIRLKPRSEKWVKRKATVGLSLQRNLVRRGPINSSAPSTFKPLRPAPEGPIPATVGQGNFMIATWTVSKFANPNEVGAKLKTAPFDCTVIIMSTAVADTDAIALWLVELAKQNADFKTNPLCDDLHREILQEKAVYRLSGNVFAAIHRAKVGNCSLVVWSTRSRGEGSDQLRLCSLNLALDTTRQRLTQMNIGIIDVKDVLSPEYLESLVAWIVMGRVSILTGNVGKNQNMVRRGLAQWIKFWRRSRGEWGWWARPTFFLCFGYFRSVTMAMLTSLPYGWHIGNDLFDEMINLDEMPQWPLNDMGSAFVPNLGSIKMKSINFERWCHNMIQTCLWTGTSTPSRSSQARQTDRSRGKSGKDKGQHKGKGKEYGKGKGKDK